MSHRHGHSWTKRVSARERPGEEAPARDGDLQHGLEQHSRSQGFKHAHTTLGVSGHILHVAAMLFPVLAAELITDAAKYRKAVQIGSVVTTAGYEILYTIREARRREKQQEKLAQCLSRD
jgi:hypothetical protein